jgi:hypothetical protein
MIPQEKSECLTRESPLVRRFDGLRRIRKALLSDLSSLVKTAKKFQEVANGVPSEDEVEAILDEMLLKAFKIVTRGVRFLDVWNEEVGLSRTIAEMDGPGESQGQYSMPPPPHPRVSIWARMGLIDLSHECWNHEWNHEWNREWSREWSRGK